MQNRLGWLNDSGPNGLFKNRSLALNPVFRPACIGIGRITMPNAGKQNQHGAGLDGLRFMRVITFEDAGTRGNENDLITLEDPSLGPFEMMLPDAW
jgi:hypothetical protein